MGMITPYLSGSKGNVFIVCDGKTRLLLECGVTLKKIQDLLGYTISSLDGCLITHEHMDHSRAARSLVDRGVPLYASPGTLKTLALDGPVVHPLEPAPSINRIGSFTVMAFPVHHDAADPVGFMFYSNHSRRKAVFIIDSYRCDFYFTGVDEIAIECNYDDDLLRASNRLPDAIKDRIRRNHMSLGGCLGFLRACDLNKTERIILLHLSWDRADADDFRRSVEDATGKEVIIA